MPDAISEKIKVTVQSRSPLKVTFEVTDPITQAGMEFLAGPKRQARRTTLARGHSVLVWSRRGVRSRELLPRIAKEVAGA